jgi:hypothetical protein
MTARVTESRTTESRTDGNEPNGEASVCRLLQTLCRHPAVQAEIARQVELILQSRAAVPQPPTMRQMAMRLIVRWKRGNRPGWYLG